MMTKTILSDGRRTRPRFAATTPTPPKFLIATFEQPKNHSTPSKQTTNPNPNSNKTLLLRPGRPCGTALLRISRPLSGLVPLVYPGGRRAQPHPRKLSGLSQWLGSIPLARPHPRNLDSLRPYGIALSAFQSKTPAGCRRYKNPTLIVTPRLKIAATARKTNEMQISNRYRTCFAAAATDRCKSTDGQRRLFAAS
jgi:hypothetical protein